VPVEQNVPALSPYLELADGRTIVAADGADEIHPSADGNSLRIVWRRWAQVGTKSGQLVTPGLTSEVVWMLRDGLLERRETVTASTPINLRTWRVVVPTTNTSAAVRSDRVLLAGGSAPLRVTMATTWPPLSSHVQTTGNTPQGRGARGAVPLHLVYEAHDFAIRPDRPLTWQIALEPGI
jgi:hypothetical protein